MEGLGLWEGPYRIIEATQSGSYKLETMAGSLIPRTWHITNLCWAFRSIDFLRVSFDFLLIAQHLLWLSLLAKEDLLAQHYSTCGMSHTLKTTTAAVTSLVPYLTKLLIGRTTPKAKSDWTFSFSPTGYEEVALAGNG